MSRTIIERLEALAERAGGGERGVFGVGTMEASRVSTCTLYKFQTGEAAVCDSFVPRPSRMGEDKVDAPNYRRATTEQSCVNCKYFKNPPS